jgi:hypothetical protein
LFYRVHEAHTAVRWPALPPRLCLRISPRSSILFPREHEEDFISDSLKFIFVMLVVCMALYVWAAVVLARMGASADRIVVGDPPPAP